MDLIHAAAPGKLFLLGEYAVLDGCPAIVAAVDAAVRVQARKQRGVQGVEVVASQLGLHIRLDRSACPTEQQPGPLGFVAACFSALSAEERLRLPAGIKLDILFPEFSKAGQKLGLGGSAALVSAVTAALIEWCYGAGGAHRFRDLVYRRSLTAHRLAQRGKGSGADVAASVFGGVILYEPNGRDLPRITPLRWPQHLYLVAASTGQPAATAELIETYDRVKRTNETVHEEFLECSTRAVASFASALQASDAVEACWKKAAQVLPAFAVKLGLPYFTPKLETLLALAQKQGVTAKPSGAGGGDCAVAVCPENKRGPLLRTWNTAECLTLALQPHAEGVRCEQA